MAGVAGVSNPTPAPERTWEPLDTPVEVIGSQFIETQHPLEITISKNKVARCLEVVDVQGSLLFQIKTKSLSMHDRTFLHDASGRIMLTLRQKGRSTHGRWEVFRGENTDDSLFSAERSSAFRTKNRMHVFLSSNTAEEVPDYKIEGSWKDKSFIVSPGGSNTTLAEIAWKKKGEITLKVAPCVDYAFIVTLVLFLGSFDPPVSMHAVLHYTFGGVSFLMSVLGLGLGVASLK